MVVVRSNSPSTVSQQAVEGTKQLQVQQPESAQQENDSISRGYLKAELKALLYEHNGCTKNKEVVDIVTKLSERNPSPKDCARLDSFPGDYFTLTAPSFPGRIKPTNSDEERVVQYTLGKLSFNIFQPNELICTVRSIRNPVHPEYNVSERKDNDDTATFTYHIIIDLTIHTPDGDLEATLINRGRCRESEGVNNRMVITFTGGTLVPGNEIFANNSEMLGLWKKTFANAYEKADKERTYLGWIYRYCLKLFLGLTLPKDAEELDGSVYENAFHFDIKRSPKGFLNVMYLDDDLRITKGNRGTISVLERVASNDFSQ